LRNSIQELNSKLSQITANSEAEIDLLQSKMDQLEQERLKMTEELTTLHDREREQLSKSETLYEEIQKLSQQIAVNEQLDSSVVSETSPTKSRRSSIGPADTDSNRLATIIKYLRNEKNKETELRMNAELDFQRLKAQCAVDERKILTLESKVTELSNQIQTHLQSLSEKDQLISQIDVLRRVQHSHGVLQKQHEALKQKSTAESQKIKELESGLLQAQSEKSKVELQVKSLEVEVEARKKEITSLRQQSANYQSALSRFGPEKLTEAVKKCDQQTQMINQLTTENEMVKKQLADETQKCQTALKESNANKEKFEKTRTLAIYHRDNYRKLVEEHNKLKVLIS
jgi:chromosome segregation ATPase